MGQASRRPPNAAQPGTVYLVGAGPGDPGLVTIRARELLTSADIVIHDSLVNPALLSVISPLCEIVFAGKSRGRASSDQAIITARMIAEAHAGRAVVRLKGGDPFLFGRGGEECLALAAAKIPFEVVPGVTAATAVSAYAGIPLTHRELASTVSFSTAHEAPNKATHTVDAAELSRFGTVVLCMGVKALAASTAALLAAGRPPETPVAIIEQGTLPEQRVIEGTLATIVQKAAFVQPPALVVVGDVTRLREQIAWAEKRPLHGRSILLTRQADAIEPLATYLERLGARVLRCPTIQTKSLATTEMLNESLCALAESDVVAFTSAAAVRIFFTGLRAAGLDARKLAGLQVASVGPATTEALGHCGIAADIALDREHSQGGGGALAEQIAAVSGQTLRVLLIRARDGNDEFARKTRENGHVCKVIDLYETISISPIEIRAHLSALGRSGRICDAWVAMSPSAVHALLAAVPREKLKNTFILAAGRTTQATLESYGLQAEISSQPLDGLIAWAQKQPEKQPSDETFETV